MLAKILKVINAAAANKVYSSITSSPSIHLEVAEELSPTFMGK